MTPGPLDAVAEEAVLAAVLSDPDVFDDLADHLSAEHFGVAAHAAIWAAFVAADAAGRPLDRITIADELRRSGQLDRIGGQERLDALIAPDGGAANVDAHAAIIIDRALLRRVLASARVMAKAASDPQAVGAEVLAAAEEEIFRLAARGGASRTVEMPQAVAQLVEQLARARTRLLLGHSSGFADIDRLTGGFQPGQLLVLAARPSMGKTAMAIQWARHIAETSGETVYFASYEMGRTELLMRMLANILGTDLRQLSQGQVPHGMERDVATATERMARLPMVVDDEPPETIGGLRSRLRRLARRRPLAAVFVDYLQLMGGDARGDENRAQVVGSISRGLKMAARELGVPIVALSQLNRGLEARVDKRPALSDLRESGAIEQDADAVFALFRPSVYYAEEDPHTAEINIIKQRSGPLGTIPLRWEGPSARYVDVAETGPSDWTPPPEVGSPF